jgi:hypothetical protein
MPKRQYCVTHMWGHLMGSACCTAFIVVLIRRVLVVCPWLWWCRVEMMAKDMRGLSM